MGRYNDPPDWTEILTYFRGSELQNYFTKVLEDDLKAFIKVQYVDQIPKAVKGTVQALLDKKDEQKIQDKICDILDLNRVSSNLMCFFFFNFGTIIPYYCPHYYTHMIRPIR